MTDYKEEANALELQIADADCGLSYEEIVKIAILSQQRVVDAYRKSANEVINSRMDYKSIIKLRDEAQNLLKELQSRL